MRNTYIYIICVILVGIFFILDLVMGSASIPLKEVFNILSGGESQKSWEYIILNFRMPKAFTAILTGAGISVAGLQMQTLFKNPLAGPSVIGISHGASLGVAIFVLASSTMFGSVHVLQQSLGSWGIILFAVLGAFMVLSFVLLASARLSDNTSVLLIGIMFGFITGSIVSILQYFSTPELIQNFLVWSFGSLAGVAWSQFNIMAPIVIVVLIFSFTLSKSMNALLLGENYAAGVGINIKKARISIISTTSLLAGTLTAFVGPIAFIGIAIPHLARLILRTSDHKKLLPATMLIGAVIMLACDIISQFPGKEITLPVNSVTALFGAPVIIAIILKSKKLKTVFNG